MLYHIDQCKWVFFESLIAILGS